NRCHRRRMSVVICTSPCMRGSTLWTPAKSSRKSLSRLPSRPRRGSRMRCIILQPSNHRRPHPHYLLLVFFSETAVNLCLILLLGRCSDAPMFLPSPPVSLDSSVHLVSAIHPTSFMPAILSNALVSAPAYYTSLLVALRP